MYFIKAAGIAPNQNPLALNFEKVKTIKALPVIINGIIGAMAIGKSPVYKEIKLGIRHNIKAVSTPVNITDIKSKALTIEPVINWLPKYGAKTAIETKMLN